MTEEIFETIDKIIQEMKDKHSKNVKCSSYSASYSYTQENGKKPQILYDIKYQDSNGKKIHKTNLPKLESKEHNCNCIKCDCQKQNKNILKQSIMVADGVKDFNVDKYLTKSKGLENIYFENGLWIDMNKIQNKEKFKELITKTIKKGTLKI